MKTDDERTNMRPLTALDEIVLDILGKGNGTTQKTEIEIPENASFLDPAFMARIKYEEDDDDENLGDDNDDSLGGQVHITSQLKCSIVVAPSLGCSSGTVLCNPFADRRKWRLARFPNT